MEKIMIKIAKKEIEKVTIVQDAIFRAMEKGVSFKELERINNSDPLLLQAEDKKRILNSRWEIVVKEDVDAANKAITCDANQYDFAYDLEFDPDNLKTIEEQSAFLTLFQIRVADICMEKDSLTSLAIFQRSAEYIETFVEQFADLKKFIETNQENILDALEEGLDDQREDLPTISEIAQDLIDEKRRTL